MKEDGQVWSIQFPDPELVPESETSQEYVYFAFCNEGLAKIGRSSQVENRMRQLNQKQFPEGVQGFGIIQRVLCIRTNNSLKLERDLHHLFRRQRGSGEWFVLSEEDIGTLELKFGDAIFSHELNASDEESKTYNNAELTNSNLTNEDGTPDMWGW